VLHPRKIRTRAAAIGWLANRLEMAVPELVASAFNEWEAQQLHNQLAQLDKLLTRLLADQAPTLEPLCRQLNTRINSKPDADTPTAALSSPATASTAALTPTAQSSTPLSVDAIATPRDAQKALRALQEQARNPCQWWRGQSVLDERAISLSRITLWLPIETLPEHDNSGKTGLRGLPGDRLNACQERLNQNQPAELRRDIETSVARAPFWLDGQYLAWRCLQGSQG